MTRIGTTNNYTATLGPYSTIAYIDYYILASDTTSPIANTNETSEERINILDTQAPTIHSYSYTPTNTTTTPNQDSTIQISEWSKR